LPLHVVLGAKTVTDITDTYRAIICREDDRPIILFWLNSIFGVFDDLKQIILFFI